MNIQAVALDSILTLFKEMHCLVLDQRWCSRSNPLQFIFTWEPTYFMTYDWLNLLSNSLSFPIEVACLYSSWISKMAEWMCLFLAFLRLPVASHGAKGELWWPLTERQWWNWIIHVEWSGLCFDSNFTDDSIRLLDISECYFLVIKVSFQFLTVYKFPFQIPTCSIFNFIYKMIRFFIFQNSKDCWYQQCN